MTEFCIPPKLQPLVAGILHCFDRIILVGSLMPICYPQGITKYFSQKGFKVFDISDIFKPVTDAIRENAERTAQENGLTIEYIRKKNFRKEDRIQQILRKRGSHPGMVHIFSALEPCATFRPWHDKTTHKTFFRPDTGKCLNYYFYFIDPEFGLCYLRVTTWAPFRLQFYCNGHHWLATQLAKKGIAFRKIDNAFLSIDDFSRANRLASQLDPSRLAHLLDRWARALCPAAIKLDLSYHWSIWQAEYATDIVFHSRPDLQALFPHWLESLVLSVKPEDIAKFFGQKLHGNYQGEVGTRLQKRFPGIRIKHSYGSVQIKLYDKFQQILRIETTCNDVSFFQQFRTVFHRDGSRDQQWASMRKDLESLPDLQGVMQSANRRYWEFLCLLETPESGEQELDSLTQSRTEDDHHYRGFQLLSREDARIFRALVQGEQFISGITSRRLRVYFPDKTKGQISRLLKRLRVHGLIRKIGNRYKYYLTRLGLHVATMLLRIRETFCIPYLSNALQPS